MSRTGIETIERINRSIEYIKYDYLHTDASLFRCVKPTIEDCRRARDSWLGGSYLLNEKQIVYDIESKQRSLVFVPNKKGSVVLIEINTARMKYISLDEFFQQYNITGLDKRSEIMDDQKAYELMLQAYRLQFNKKK